MPTKICRNGHIILWCMWLVKIRGLNTSPKQLRREIKLRRLLNFLEDFTFMPKHLICLVKNFHVEECYGTEHFKWPFGNTKKYWVDSISSAGWCTVAHTRAVRWSSCGIRVMPKLKDFVWEYLRPLLGIENYSQILNKNASLVIWLLTMSKSTHFSKLSISRLTT